MALLGPGEEDRLLFDRCLRVGCFKKYNMQEARQG